MLDRGEAITPQPPTFRARALPAHGWIPLGERPHAELVFRTVTKPWRALGGEPKQPVTAQNFADFSEPGFATLAESTSVSPYGTPASLTLETRVAATADDSRRRFRRYWQMTGLFIALIRPSVMRALDRQLRHGPRPVDE